MSNRAVIYTRSSKDRNDISIDTQRRDLHALAVQRGLVVVGEFADAVERADDWDRPGFAKLLKAVADANRGWEVLLVMDTSRLARDNELLGATIRHECKKRGITIAYAKFPSINPMSDLMVQSVDQLFARLHSMMSREKGLAGMAENVRQGWRAGGRAPRGYKLEYTATGAVREGMPVTKSKLVISDDAPAIGAYLKGRAKGEARGLLAARLRLTIPVASLIGMEWQALTYAGHTVWNVHAERNGGAYVGGSKRKPRSDWLITRDTHEAIITDAEAETLLSAIEQYKARRTRATAVEYLLTGLLMTPAGEQWHGDDGNCYRLGKGKRISSARVERAVLDRVKADLTGEDAITRIAKSMKGSSNPAETKKRIASTEKRIADLTVKISRLIDLTASVDDPTPYLRRVSEMEAERAGLAGDVELLRTDIAQAQAAKSFGTAEIRLMLESLWRDLEERNGALEVRAALREMIERVELDPEGSSVKVCYRIPAESAFSAETTGVILASPRVADLTPVAEWSSIGDLPRRWG